MYASFLTATYVNMTPEEISAGPGIYAPIITSMAASCAVLLAWRNASKDKQHVWMLMLSGVTLWVAADVVWGVMDMWGWMEQTYFSLADVLWLSGYLPVAAAFWLYLAPLHVTFRTPKRIFVLAVICILPLLTLGMLINDLVANPGENVWEKIVPMIYPVMDILLAGGGLLIAFTTRKHWEHLPWLVLGLAMILFAFGDTWYALASLNGWYEENIWVRLSVDLPDTLANLTVAIGAMLSLQGVDEYMLIQRDRTQFL